MRLIKIAAVLFSASAGLLAGTSMAASAAVAATAPASPQVVIQQAVDVLTTRIVKERKTLQASPVALNALVEQHIEPFVDIPGIARGVMGQFYRQSSPAQRERFTQLFRQSMVRTYANGLVAYDNEKIVVKPFKAGDDPSRASVDVEITLDNGTVVPVTFQMVLDANRQWKARNLIVNGLNLGLTFRKRFAEVVEQSGGNIDKAIAGWSPGPVEVVKAKPGNPS